GFRLSLAKLGRRIAGTPAARFTGLAALVVAVVALGGTTAAIIDAPHSTSAAAMINQGAQAVKDAAKTPSPTPTPTQTGAPDAQEEEIRIPDGTEITAVGDSVMLASAPSLFEEFPGIT